jgi:hypothetical protein
MNKLENIPYENIRNRIIMNDVIINIRLTRKYFYKNVKITCTTKTIDIIKYLLKLHFIFHKPTYNLIKICKMPEYLRFIELTILINNIERKDLFNIILRDIYDNYEINEFYTFINYEKIFKNISKGNNEIKKYLKYISRERMITYRKYQRILNSQRRK